MIDRFWLFTMPVLGQKDLVPESKKVMVALTLKSNASLADAGCQSVNRGTPMEKARERVQQEMNNLQAEIRRLEEKLQSKPDYGHGTGDPGIYEWEMNLALLRKMEQRAKSVEQILQHMDEGTYGICEICGREINPERLEALPYTTRCIECAQRQYA